MSPRPHRRAFALIELLVVVAMIGALAAILFPVYTGARDASKRAACESNLAQIGRAFHMYLQDWGETYPCTGDPYLWMGRHWRWAVRKYIRAGFSADPSDPGNPRASVGSRRGVLFCPSDTVAASTWDYTSYAYSAAFYHTPAQVDSMTTAMLWDPKSPAPPATPQKAGGVASPARKAMVGEWLSNHSLDKVGWWDAERRGERNYLFADGHVSLVAASAIQPTVTGLPDVNLTMRGVMGRDLD